MPPIIDNAIYVRNVVNAWKYAREMYFTVHERRMSQ